MIDKILALTLLPVLMLSLFIFFIPQYMLYQRVFFIQKRPGKDGSPFLLFKFQTMRNNSDEDEKRVTLFGDFLRKTSLDELPQILNVLKGEMSFIGPRPLLMNYLDKYSSYHQRRHEVKPGITGLAQINGRNLISWEEKFDLDVRYVDRQSFGMDMSIIFKTFLLIFTSVTDSRPIEEFEGYGRKIEE